LQALQQVDQVNDWIRLTVTEREKLVKTLGGMNIVEKIYPSDANFILVKTIDARAIYEYLVNKGIIVRDRSKVELCEGCLRITIGTQEENQILTETLQKFQIKK
jgi:histidinol-phosphate aminotransferase